MTAPYCAGCVWWGFLDFGKGPAKKYFVLLTDCVDVGDQAIVAITTSKGEERYGPATATGKPCRCPDQSCFRIDRGQEACFAVTTWVQFDNGPQVARVSRAGLDASEKAHQGGFLKVLDSERIRSLLKCATQSKDIATRDISRIDAKLKALLAALKAAATASKAPSNPSSTVGTTTSAAPVHVISAAIDTMRVRFNNYCANCRMSFIGLIGISDADLEAILAGSKSPSDNFVPDAEAGFELVGTCGCVRCA
jgi:hypothetical protein